MSKLGVISFLLFLINIILLSAATTGAAAASSAESAEIELGQHDLIYQAGQRTIIIRGNIIYLWQPENGSDKEKKLAELPEKISRATISQDDQLNINLIVLTESGKLKEFIFKSSGETGEADIFIPADQQIKEFSSVYSTQQKSFYLVFSIAGHKPGAPEGEPEQQIFLSQRPDDAPGWIQPRLVGQAVINQANNKNLAIATDQAGAPVIYWTQPAIFNEAPKIFGKIFQEEGLREIAELNKYQRGIIRGINAASKFLLIDFDGPGFDLASEQIKKAFTGKSPAGVKINNIFWLFWQQNNLINYSYSKDSGITWQNSQLIKNQLASGNIKEIKASSENGKIFLLVIAEQENNKLNASRLEISESDLLPATPTPTPAPTTPLAPVQTPVPATTVAPVSPTAEAPATTPTPTPAQPTQPAGTPQPTATAEIYLYVSAIQPAGRGPRLILPTATPTPPPPTATPTTQPPTATSAPTATARPTNTPKPSGKGITGTNEIDPDSAGEETGETFNFLPLVGLLLAAGLIGKGTLNFIEQQAEKKRQAKESSAAGQPSQNEELLESESDEGELISYEQE